MSEYSEKVKYWDRKLVKIIINANFVIAVIDLLLIPYGMIKMPLEFSDQMFYTQIGSAILFTGIGILFKTLDKKRPMSLLFPK